MIQMLKYTIAIYTNISDCEDLLKRVATLYLHFMHLEILRQTELIFRKENLEHGKRSSVIVQ